MDITLLPSENELVSLIKENSKPGFDYLYRNYGAALSVVIGKIITDRHTAEDILQETFVNIWANIDKYDPEKGRLYTWMRNIAVNKCRDFLRCALHTMRSRTTGNEAQISTTLHKTEQKTDRIGVNQLIAQLPADHQAVICMAYYNGHTLQEISGKLNTPIGTVKSRMRKAISILKADFAFVA